MNKAQIAKLANPVISAITAAEQSQVKVGDAVLAAAAKLDKASIKPFCDTIKVSLEKKGFTPKSIKVTTMYIRRVVTAIVVNGLKPEPGQSLRGLYASLPKKQTGGASHARKINAAEKEKREEKPAELSKVRTISVEDAVRTIFGHADDELMAAVEWARQNEMSFVRYARANIAAAAAAEVVATAKSAAKRLRKAA